MMQLIHFVQENTLWLAIGLVLAALLILYARKYRAWTEKKILAWALVVAAAIYVIFAFIWGDVGWVLIELFGIPVYGVFAWMALRYSGYWLALGWLLHPLWDAGLHLFGNASHIAPDWYAVACISFDILVAFYVLIRTPSWKRCNA